MKAGNKFGAITSFDTDKLRALIKERWDGSRSAFARYCGIDPVVLSKMLRRGSCCVWMIFRLSKGLGMSPLDLLDSVAIWRNAPQRCRTRANLTVGELAEKSGIGVSTIETVEGGGDCYAFSALCLSQALGVSIEEYLGYGA